MATTVSPSFTGSVAPFIQGINVDSYQRFGGAITPLLCRSDPDIYFLSSSSGTREITINQTFFDDSFRYPAPMASASGGKAVVEIGDDPTRIICVPSYFREERQFGIEKDFGDIEPFQEMGKWDSVAYLRNADDIQWPVVLDNPSAIDPFEFSGVIEPLAIRKVITQLSTFMGNHQDPEPHSVKGMVNSGQLAEDATRDTFEMSSFYEPKLFINSTPFEYVTDVSLDVFSSLISRPRVTKYTVNTINGLQSAGTFTEEPTRWFDTDATVHDVRLTAPNKWGKPFDYTSAATSSIRAAADVTPFEVFPKPQISDPSIFRYFTSASIPYDLTSRMMGGFTNDENSGEYAAQDALVAWWRFNTNISGSQEINPPTVSNSVTGSNIVLGPYFSNLSTPQAYPTPSSLYPSKLMQSGSSYFLGTDRLILTSSTDSGGILNFGSGGTDKAFSISTWIRFASYLPAGGGVRGGIVAKGESNTVFQYQLFTDGITTPSLQFRVGDSSGISDTAAYIGITLAYSRKPLVLDQWHHIVATYDGNGVATQSGLATMKLYIDGIEQKELTENSSGTYAGRSAVSAMPFQVGSMTRKYYAINGYVAEVALWEKVLSTTEIKGISPRFGGVWDRTGTAIATKGGVRGRPTATAKSAPRGFTYDNSLLGIDSVAFGGLLK